MTQSKIKYEYYLRAMMNIRCNHCGEMIIVNFSEKNFPDRNKKYNDEWIT